ncbi:hypothetical protein A2160_01410 [Candidatus Beckwithbacteria bacterium RBG_13_42_9]|uniref:Uncharacterized protein n=1 Tax=Candidatus Beckwithbacteria bacterium RBG_13_42_9 TaxID=1797457 RepID=A0A1F5E930_9BACT|nr:MAG: hypothetical protein A2160_01410 [Candidatus Beckwithbacteria bacterium RBG_13_42_9]
MTYDKDPLVVTSHKSVSDYGQVTIDLGGKPTVFDVALLRSFHGNPCEIISLTLGGRGYSRNKR